MQVTAANRDVCRAKANVIKAAAQRTTKPKTTNVKHTKPDELSEGMPIGSSSVLILCTTEKCRMQIIRIIITKP